MARDERGLGENNSNSLIAWRGDSDYRLTV